jgi:hypothetical protein
VIELKEKGQATFSYTEGYGIHVNWGKHEWYGTPENSPVFFRPGIVIRDNWMFLTKRVAILASGKGLVVKDNVRRDVADKVAWIGPAGERPPKGSDTFENRGIHVTGSDVLVEGNDLELYQHILAPLMKYRINDGEGIMMDNTGALVDGWIVRNNKVNAPVMIYRTKDLRRVLIENNEITAARHGNCGGAGVFVWADVNKQPPSRADDVRIIGNRITGGISVLAGAGGREVVIEGNHHTGGSNKVDVSKVVEAKIGNNEGFIEIRK